MNTIEVKAALAARYPVGKFVRVFECPSYNVGGRFCDLMAFGVWGSTKNQIIGHEIKVSRSDWQKELQQPEKSDAFLPYVNSWWIVAPKGIVKVEELRADWGLMEVLGGGIKIRRQASVKTPEPMPPNMLASILRRVTQSTPEDTELAVKRAVEHERQTNADREGWRIKRLENEVARQQERISQFENKSGIHIDLYNGDNVGKAIATLRNCDPALLLRNIEIIAEQSEGLAADTKKRLESLRSAMDEIRELDKTLCIRSANAV